MARDPLDKIITQVRGEVQLHVRRCTPLFRFSQTVGRIVFKFGVWRGLRLRGLQSRSLRVLRSLRFTVFAAASFAEFAVCEVCGCEFLVARFADASFAVERFAVASLRFVLRFSVCKGSVRCGSVRRDDAGAGPDALRCVASAACLV